MKKQKKLDMKVLDELQNKQIVKVILKKKINLCWDNINQFVSMNDKQKLIDSMSNLIYHVSSSRKNQQQIFHTLSIGDLNKIISNLQDTNQRLRKTTLILLSELLFQNSILQKKFCQFTGLSEITGKVVLSSSFPKSLLYDKHSLAQVIQVLKDNSTQKQKGLFWYIDVQTKQKSIQIGKRNSFIPDPLTCIVGVWMNFQNNNLLDSPVKTTEVVGGKIQNKKLIEQKIGVSKNTFPQKQAYSEVKPETPIHNSNNFSQLSMTQSLKYKSTIYTDTYQHNINKSSLRIQPPKIVYTNSSQRKNFETSRPINYQSYTAPLTSTNQYYVQKNPELFQTMASTTVSINSNRVSQTPNIIPFQKQQYRNR